MKNRSKLIITSFLLILVFSFSYITAIAGPVQPSINLQEAEAVINTFSRKTITYSIEDVKCLKSVSDNVGYKYVLYELKPYGYAILTTDNIPMQICYEESVIPPIAMDDGNTYYYTCPGFAVENSGILINCETRQEISQEKIDSAKSVERKVNSQIKEREEMRGSLAATSVEAYEVPNAEYFENLFDYGTNSTGNSCTAVAATMILGYYDKYVNDNYVASGYSQTTSGGSTGTSEAFHSLLCSYIWGNNPIQQITLTSAVAGLNNYLNDQSFSNYFAVSPIAANMEYFISTNRPVIGSLYVENGASSNHAVVAYGSMSTSSVTVYSIHYGYKDKQSPSNWQILNESLFGDLAYIYDCMFTGNHAYEYKYTFSNYHSGNYHYYQKIKHCTMCPVDDTYIWEQLPCNNCIEMMSLPVA